MSNITIIPARGGSRGIPRKNLIDVCGQPLLSYSIEAALRSSVYMDAVVVSTDDDEIGEVAEDHNATWLRRPEHLAQDDSSTEGVVRHALKELDVDLDGLVFLLQPTSPIRQVSDLGGAYDQFRQQKLDALFSASLLYQYTWHEEPIDGRLLRTFYSLAERPMRQEKRPVICENGSFYISKAWCYLSFDNRMWGKIGYYEQPWWCGVEIDNEGDIEICELLMQWRPSEIV